MEVILPLLLTLPPAAAPIIGISLSLGVFIVGAMFAVSYVLQSSQMIALAKEELAALIFTALILLFWVGSDGILNGITSGLLLSSLPESLHGSLTSNACSGGSNPGCVNGIMNSHLTLAIASLNIIEQKLRGQYIDLYLFEALIGFLSTISFPLGSPVPAVNIISFSLAPFTGLTLLSNAHTVVVEAIGYLITILWAKEFILIFSRDVIPIMLFPFGLVMRAIPFYRKTGSTIIALAFAMYFVLPFAVILSNYLIFDLFKPADFTYTPSSASYFGTGQDQSYFKDKIGQAQNGPETSNLLNEFQGKSIVEEAYDQDYDKCAGNALDHLICSFKNIGNSVFGAIGGFVKTVFSIWKFMIGMTGDFFFTLFNNPLMPAGASAGLFHFLIEEVATISPFIILVTLSTIIEIIITITTFRNISILIGGEAEIIGLSKVI